MQKNLLLLLMLFAIVSNAQKKKVIDASIGYQFSMPMGNMSNYINSIHSVNSTATIAIPGTNEKLMAGLDFNIGWYGMLRQPINYALGNNRFINTTVEYSSTMSQFGPVVRYHFTNKGKLRPYVHAGVAYTRFASSLFVNDPNDIDQCRPLEQATLIKDNAWTTNIGGGLHFFISKQGNIRDFIDFSVTSVQGPAVNYINVRNYQHHHGTTNPTVANPNTKAVNVRFIDLTNNNIHEHKVAEVYNSAIALLNIRLTYVARLNW